MEILLIRHGMTRGNLEHRYVGRTDEALCAQGVERLRRQFAELVRQLSVTWSDCVRDNAGDRIFCGVRIRTSPMRRCIQTAELLAAYMGQVSLDLVRVQGLQEMDFGKFEYKNYEELRNDNDYQRYLDTNGRSAFPGAETWEGFRKRCIHAFAGQLRILESQQVQKAVFVMHGGSIMSVMEHFARPQQDYFCWQVENGGGFRLKIVKNGEGGMDLCQVLQRITYSE